MAVCYLDGMSEQHPIPDLTEDERACLLEYCGTKARDGVGDHAVDVIDTLRAMLLRAKTPESEQIVALSEALSRWVEEWQTTEDARASFEEGFNRERRANKDLREQWDVLAAHAEERRIRAERLEAENATLRTALGIQESHSPPYTRAADDAERMGLNPAEPAFRHIVEPQARMRALSAEEIRQACTWSPWGLSQGAESVTAAITAPVTIEGRRAPQPGGVLYVMPLSGDLKLTSASQEPAAPAVQEMCCGGTCVRSMCPYHGGNQ